jgi:hypothetical protein
MKNERRMSMIRHNRIRCKKCGDVIESAYMYDLVTCSCCSITIEGGMVFRRVTWPSGRYEDWVEDLSEKGEDD